MKKIDSNNFDELLKALAELEAESYFNYLEPLNEDETQTLKGCLVKHIIKWYENSDEDIQNALYDGYNEWVNEYEC